MAEDLFSEIPLFIILLIQCLILETQLHFQKSLIHYSNFMLLRIL